MKLTRMKPAEVLYRRLNPKSQLGMILGYLMEYGRIDAMDALDWCGCMRLAARISDLRDYGLTIHTEMRKSGKGKRYASYVLDAEDMTDTWYTERELKKWNIWLK